MSNAFKIETEVSAQRVADMFVGAIEGGSTYWCKRILIKSRGASAPVLPEQPWYCNGAFFEDDSFVLEVTEDEGDTHEVTPAGIAKGLALMAQKSPAQFAAIIDENDDAITADLFLQYVALGEVVYG